MSRGHSGHLSVETGDGEKLAEVMVEGGEE